MRAAEARTVEVVVQADSHADMSRKLIIYKTGRTPEEIAPLGDLGRVTDALNGAFINLEWESRTAAALPAEGGFRVNLSMRGVTVQDIHTDGGFNHLREFAGLCKRQGWRMADAQEGEDVDLNDPQRWHRQRSARTARSSHTETPATIGSSGSRRGRFRRCALWSLAAAITLYVALYFVCSDIQRSQMLGERMTFRVFQHRSALRVWAPLLEAEKLLRREKFQGHVANGASLPPPAPN
jgi:hypothetical protein